MGRRAILNENPILPEVPLPDGRKRFFFQMPKIYNGALTLFPSALTKNGFINPCLVNAADTMIFFVLLYFYDKSFPGARHISFPDSTRDCFGGLSESARKSWTRPRSLRAQSSGDYFQILVPDRRLDYAFLTSENASCLGG